MNVMGNNTNTSALTNLIQDQNINSMESLEQRNEFYQNAINVLSINDSRDPGGPDGIGQDYYNQDNSAQNFMKLQSWYGNKGNPDQVETIECWDDFTPDPFGAKGTPDTRNFNWQYLQAHPNPGNIIYNMKSDNTGLSTGTARVEGLGMFTTRVNMQNEAAKKRLATDEYWRILPTDRRSNKNQDLNNFAMTNGTITYDNEFAAQQSIHAKDMNRYYYNAGTSDAPMVIPVSEASAERKAYKEYKKTMLNDTTT